VEPTGGKLDRRRQTVDDPADVRDKPKLFWSRLKAGPRRSRALQEELHRLCLGAVGTSTVGRNRERPNLDPVLAGSPQYLAARREDAHTGTFPKDGRHEAGDVGREALALVDDEQCLRVA
jgi:hypothetical protein